MFRPGFRAFESAFRTVRSPARFRPAKHAQSRAYRQIRFGDKSPQGAYGRLQFISSFFRRWAARPTFYRDVGLISLGTGGAYVYNLEEVPISGRRRFNIISPRIEAQIGAATVGEVQQQYQGQMLPDWHPTVRRVKKVLERLIPFAEEAGLHDVDWEIHVIDSPEANAFVAPGGKVFVFTGILPLCEDDNGIAAVLGHEIAHVVAHHTAEKLSQAPFVLLGVLALMTFDLSFQLSSAVLNLFLSMPAGRKQEAEADQIGLMIMARACYRPEAAMEFWHRMETTGGAAPPELLSTHPSHHNREEKIRGWLPRAHEQAERSECGATSLYAQQFNTFWGR
ncbi:hypothetical protein DPSP01_008592 [Paraphaeosphaeria sporulosa]|uniref:Peptidase M48 domain-containing protein n=1 Tax=Paraphaeosphaeria sporulosa TaxID=1460663 RepID=A0A177BXD1_9PLEO|nr:uncharacterized protein CC84DRAFT_1264322 [Paraphaeosphaeria sporulosa]OAF99348.1 hypothetical protein CC84DRAFT_1264322 [Paraphaeosphaeria sporulosa]